MLLFKKDNSKFSKCINSLKKQLYGNLLRGRKFEDKIPSKEFALERW